jgi:mRNA-degrading endonuclease RelE of RelBE toxin-antitoxin system
LAYSLLASPAAQRQLDSLPPDIADGLRTVLHSLAEHPNSKRFDVKKLEGPQRDPPLLRLRLGDYRVILVIRHASKDIVVVRVGRRAAVYRGLGTLGD